MDIQFKLKMYWRFDIICRADTQLVSSNNATAFNMVFIAPLCLEARDFLLVMQLGKRGDESRLATRRGDGPRHTSRKLAS